jgi:hypothetical protein
MEQSASMGTARLVRASSLACAAAALLCVLGGLVLGSPAQGGLAGLGLLIGAVNAHLAQRLMRTGLPLPGTSMLRLGALSALVLVTGLVVGLGRVWLVVVGVAAAQLVMAAAAVLEMTRR